MFLDDDNLADRDYLANALEISRSFEFLGAWGAGAIEPEFEATPPRGCEPELGYLALRTLHEDVWSKDVDDLDSIPFGAGLCVRKAVADAYAAELATDALRRSLGRRGAQIFSNEDVDLALTSARLQLGWGNFPRLRITHLIAADRVRPDYLEALIAGTTASSVISARSTGRAMPPASGRLRRTLRYLDLRVRKGRQPARFYLARQRGARLGRQLLRDAGPDHK